MKKSTARLILLTITATFLCIILYTVLLMDRRMSDMDHKINVIGEATHAELGEQTIGVSQMLIPLLVKEGFIKNQSDGQ